MIFINYNIFINFSLKYIHLYNLVNLSFLISVICNLMFWNIILSDMAPEIAKPAPDFEGIAVVNGAFKNIKLSDYKGKYVVLFFYPLDL